MLRTLLGWVIFVITTVILGTSAILISLFDSSGDLPHLVARLWGKIQLRTTGTRVKVTGLQNIDPQKSYILVSNHQSNFDIFALLGYLPIQFRWIAKAELFRSPFLGWAMTRIGYISIERDSPKKAYRSMLRAAEAVKKGVSVMIFPEGTRSPDGRLQPFKKASFSLPSNPGRPSCPSPSRGRPRSCPRATGEAYPGKVQIIIDPPMDTAGIPPEQEEELSQRVRSTLDEKSDRYLIDSRIGLE